MTKKTSELLFAFAVILAGLVILSASMRYLTRYHNIVMAGHYDGYSWRWQKQFVIPSILHRGNHARH